jgi:hypothetical protein
LGVGRDRGVLKHLALKPTPDPTERTQCKEGSRPDGKDPRIASPVLNRLITGQNMTMAQIGDELQRVAVYTDRIST